MGYPCLGDKIIRSRAFLTNSTCIPYIYYIFKMINNEEKCTSISMPVVRSISSLITLLDSWLVLYSWVVCQHKVCIHYTANVAFIHHINPTTNSTTKTKMKRMQWIQIVIAYVVLMESLPISQIKSFSKIICVCKIDFGWVAMFSTVAKLKNNYCNCIKFHSPRCLGQETAKGSFSLRVKLPPAHLSTTHSRGFTLSPKLLNAKQGSCEYQFL